MDVFRTEAEFEEALIKILQKHGWEEKVLKNYTEEDLIQNWADILYENNKSIDRLDEYPLTRSEMDQIIDKINELRTPLNLNGLINGKTIEIKRDNEDDKNHFGKEISLKIYDRQEIAAGQSRYQIAQQPRFSSKSKYLNDRRGDITLLINGMPVIHIELKKNGVPLSYACNQIKKYSEEAVFTGLFSLVQIFVAMTPEESVYFANPGRDGKFNSDYYFHWADFNNERIDNWKDFTSKLLSIPMAHQLIGFYTIADDSDGILKVLRSYQYYAANAISDKVSKIKWGEAKQRGGYIWHTTGSGKTMTSFKSAQLIANSNDADKVVFLTDRIELGTQSLKEYRSFADDREYVQETEDTRVLITKLKSDDYRDTLIVTSIQKMSKIQEENGGLNLRDLELINKKRVVFIVDEAHRSTFGKMLLTIKETFPNAIFFGFTGTPIHEENQKKSSTTTSVFGDELHRYSISDGIRDKNVLGFDVNKVMTFKDSELREVVALEKAKANSVSDVLGNKKKEDIYYKYITPAEVGMIAKDDESQYGDKKGIEDYVPNAQYKTKEHQNKVVEDIKNNFFKLSKGKFHAIFATSSIPEAIDYYKLVKKEIPEIKVTCLFDPHIDNTDGTSIKREGLVEILDDYNELYEQNFDIPTHAKFKKDIALRLAHKEYYKGIEADRSKQLDLLIVVDQMLTGFDSKWINTLYLDKVIEYENIIQAFSRTNRLFGHEKPCGIIRYYRRPHRMEENIEKAIELYSGNKPLGLFVEKIDYNVRKMNEVFKDIEYLFKTDGVGNFEKLPEKAESRAKFAKLFKELNDYLEVAKVQDFRWDKKEYLVEVEEGDEKPEPVISVIEESDYVALLQRYSELKPNPTPPSGNEAKEEDIVYDLEGYLTEVHTGMIDSDYMQSKFEKYLKALYNGKKETIEQALEELHKTFAILSQEEQKFANILINDIQRGDVIVEENKSLRDYINEYQFKSQDDRVHRFSMALGLDEKMLRDIMDLNLNESNINEFNRFDNLIKTVDKELAKKYLEEKEEKKLKPREVNIKKSQIIRKFILSGGFDI